MALNIKNEEVEELVSEVARLTGESKTQADVARQGYLEFGEGLHPAALNYGDCFSYALAKVTGEPLLFKGADFSLTDVEIVPV